MILLRHELKTKQLPLVDIYTNLYLNEYHVKLFAPQIIFHVVTKSIPNDWSFYNVKNAFAATVKLRNFLLNLLFNLRILIKLSMHKFLHKLMF